MGRGGPPEPEIVRVRPTVDALLELSRAGPARGLRPPRDGRSRRGATVGCRRCGGGLAGAVAVRTCSRASRSRSALGPDLVVLDGSGAALPPVAADRRLLVTSAAQPDRRRRGLHERLPRAHRRPVVVTMAEADAPHVALADAMRAHVRPGPRSPRRAAPAAARGGRGRAGRVLLHRARRAHAALAAHLEERTAPRRRTSRGTSPTARRLRVELARDRRGRLLVELKAAAVDVVVEEASRRGVRVVRRRERRRPDRRASRRSTSSSSGSPRRRCRACEAVR